MLTTYFIQMLIHYTHLNELIASDDQVYLEKQKNLLCLFLG